MIAFPGPLWPSVPDYGCSRACYAWGRQSHGDEKTLWSVRCTFSRMLSSSVFQLCLSCDAFFRWKNAMAHRKPRQFKPGVVSQMMTRIVSQSRSMCHLDPMGVHQTRYPEMSCIVTTTKLFRDEMPKILKPITQNSTISRYMIIPQDSCRKALL